VREGICQDTCSLRALSRGGHLDVETPASGPGCPGGVGLSPSLGPEFILLKVVTFHHADVRCCCPLPLVWRSLGKSDPEIRPKWGITPPAQLSGLGPTILCLVLSSSQLYCVCLCMAES
jgi:hypothetical protein